MNLGLRQKLWSFGLIVAFFATWQLFCVVSGMSDLILPRPTDVLTTLIARFVGRTCETVLDRLSVLTRSSFRLTEEVEQVRAGQIDYQAEETLRLHAKNTLVSSKGLVKVDAEQIHMG